MPTEIVFNKHTVYPNITLQVWDTNGVQVGLVESLFPMRGTCRVHLLAHDAFVNQTCRVLPETVERHYGECVVVCETETLVTVWEIVLEGAVRTRVVRAPASGAPVEPKPLSPLVKKGVDALNDAEFLKDKEAYWASVGLVPNPNPMGLVPSEYGLMTGHKVGDGY